MEAIPFSDTIHVEWKVVNQAYEFCHFTSKNFAHFLECPRSKALCYKLWSYLGNKLVFILIINMYVSW